MNAVLSIALWAIGLLHFILIGFPVLVLLALIPARRVFPLARILCRNQLRVMGCRLEVVGGENIPADRAVLLLGNHESLFDIFAVGGALVRYAVGLEAAEHFSYPLWGRISRAWGNLPLPEGRIGAARRALKTAAEALSRGTDIIVLPEGHRTRTGRLGDLKKGAFHLALAAEVDIVPFVLQGLYEFHNTHSWRLRPRTLRIVYGEPIPRETFRDDTLDTLRTRVREILLDLDGNRPL